MAVALPFEDRRSAGRLLGHEVQLRLAPAADTLILGLVRGGAVVAAEVAAVAQLDWDVLIVRKIGAPGHVEYAVGAYAESGGHLFNPQAIARLGLSQAWRDAALVQAARECAALQAELRPGMELPVMAGRSVTLVDDGMATGLTMLTAIAAVRLAGASSVLVAVPVLAPSAIELLRQEGIEATYLACPDGFEAVGQYYRDFSAVSSGEVRQLLEARQSRTPTEDV